ncbi:MAG: transporter substrate-binding domain-containing protein [Desulfobacula sp.]|nr:transporter substrate-binding domain-containing protein [Desulfobacula sp.]
MKKLLVIYFLLVVSLLASGAMARDSIRISTGEWAPYISESLQEYGVVSQIVSEAFRLENIKVEYGFFPWGRSMAAAERGIWDATSVWYYHEDREKLFFMSDPVFAIEEVFFHLKDVNFQWDDWSDLQGLSIGGTRAYTVTKILEDKQEEGGFQLEIVPTDEANFRKLLLERIDLFPLTKTVAFVLLKKKFSSKEIRRITFHPKSVNFGELYLLFSKKDPEAHDMRRRFNRGLQKLKASGRYEQLMKPVSPLSE